MNIHGPINLSQQLNWPSDHEQSPTNKRNPQNILEGNSTPLSSANKTGKASRIDPQKKADNPDTFFSSKLPYFPQNTKPSQYITEKVISARKLSLEKINQTPQEMAHRTQFILHTLALARICHQTKQFETEETLLDSIKTVVDCFLLCKYFQFDTHFVKYLLDSYHGIACLDMHEIRERLLTLRRAIALSTTPQKLIVDLEQATEFLETRWEELKNEGQISEEFYRLLNQQLEQVLTEDPFKDEFITNSELFKKIKEAPSILLKKYPHLASVKNFLFRYPEAGTIPLKNRTYNLQNLKLTLSDAEASPLTQTINLLVEKPVINSTAAKLIRDFMLKHPKVKIRLSDEADGVELAKSFLKDNTLVLNRGSLVLTKDVVTGCNKPIYSYMIDPQYHFIRR